MSKIVDFNTKKPIENPIANFTGPAYCVACHHRWQAAAPVGTLVIMCPNCHTERALLNCLLKDEDRPVWTCNCSCQVFQISQKGAMCIKCGEYQPLRVHYVE